MSQSPPYCTGSSSTPLASLKHRSRTSHVLLRSVCEPGGGVTLHASRVLPPLNPSRSFLSNLAYSCRLITPSLSKSFALIHCCKEEAEYSCSCGASHSVEYVILSNLLARPSQPSSQIRSLNAAWSVFAPRLAEPKSSPPVRCWGSS